MYFIKRHDCLCNSLHISVIFVQLWSYSNNSTNVSGNYILEEVKFVGIYLMNNLQNDQVVINNNGKKFANGSDL